MPESVRPPEPNITPGERRSQDIKAGRLLAAGAYYDENSLVLKEGQIAEASREMTKDFARRQKIRQKKTAEKLPPPIKKADRVNKEGFVPEISEPEIKALMQQLAQVYTPNQEQALAIINQAFNKARRQKQDNSQKFFFISGLKDLLSNKNKLSKRIESLRTLLGSDSSSGHFGTSEGRGARERTPGNRNLEYYDETEK